MGDPLRFFIHFIANHQKIKRGTLDQTKLKKNRTMPKKAERGRDPLVSSSFVCYAKTLLVQFPG